MNTILSAPGRPTTWWVGLFIAFNFVSSATAATPAEHRPRAREAGVRIGILEPGPLNAITDVAGVTVGQVTLIEGASTRTGVTAILPHRGDIFRDRVPAGAAVGNGHGKFAGLAQVEELGELETPIALTNTLSVAAGLTGVIDWTLEQPGNGDVRSVNAVVGETNDGVLNDIRARRVSPAHVRQAIASARSGPVEEGAVGAGTGTVAFGYKGGIGTSSRRLPASLGGYTVGVLVQTNYGGQLTISGQPIGQALGNFYLREAVADSSASGSIVVVIATDAPLSDRNLRRMAKRAFLGIGRTGSPIVNDSGDFAIAFSTAPEMRRTATARETILQERELPNNRVSPLFQATVEATEEAVLNSLFKAQTMTGQGVTIEALPLDKVLPLLRK